MDLPCKIEARWQSILEIPEQGLDCVQTCIAGADRIASFGLEMVEEVEDHFHRQLLDCDGTEPDAAR